MRSDRGFTLIEVMVALAVFSLAILALVRLQGAGVRGAGLVDEALVAQMVARNVALDAYTEARPPVSGRASGVEQNGRAAWRWTRQVSSIGDAGVFRIDVAVQNNAGQVVGRLTVIRPPSIAS